MTEWNVDLYNRFKAQRQRPFEDLLDLLPPTIGGSMVDLGCGDGRLTRIAAERFGMRAAVGVDQASEMLARASETEDPESVSMSWHEGDLRDVLEDGEQFELVVSNAALQFVDGHDSVFPRMLGKVSPGGWIAVHIPYNHIARTHLLLDAAATSDEFQPDFEGFGHRWPQERPEVYARAMKRAEFRFTSVQLRTYRHALASIDAVVDWIKAGAARPYLAHLEESRHEAFLEKYARLLTHAYEPVGDDDMRLLDYTRLLIVGQRRP